MCRLREILKFIILTLFISAVTSKASNNDPRNVENFWENQAPGYQSSIEDDEYRLPKSIEPRSYDILISTNPSDKNFTGSVTITADVIESTKNLVFHVGGSLNTDKFLVKSGEEVLKIESTAYHEFTDKQTINLQNSVSKGTRIAISTSFKGVLNDQMVGFYRSSYFEASGKRKYLAATQFQGTYARHVFPCFDEPAFKATFNIIVIRPEKYKTIGNMRLAETKKLPNGLYQDTFQKTVPMSTYLVAFVISELRSISNNAVEDEVRIWARPEAIAQAEFALEVAPKVIQQLSRTFGNDGKLGKTDLVAVPDFSAGAMENWGLLTFREIYLLYDSKSTSAKDQQKVARIISHECTHLWFGNLVTPAWWDFFWLSEAFARYFEYVVTNQIEPKWKLDQQFLVDLHHVAFADDALETSTPMSKRTSTQLDIASMSNTINYEKGSSVLRMVQLFLGNSFNDALRDYLRSKRYDNAKPEDLWKSIQRQVDLSEIKIPTTIENIMNTWTTQAGYPVVSVSIKNGKAEFRQERFLLRNLQETPINDTWWVPITWTTQKEVNFENTEPKFWLGERSGNVKVNLAEKDWIVFNVLESGYYRVNYDNATWQKIIDTLNSDQFDRIDPINRAAIIDDLFNLARANLVDYRTAFNGLQYIRNEMNYIPFKAALTALEFLRQRFDGQSEYNEFRKIVLVMIEKTYNKLGFEDRKQDDWLTIFLRRELNEWACKLDHEECISRSLEYFEKFKKGKTNPISPNQREIVYKTAIRLGKSEDWEFLWKKYLQADSAAEKISILNSLGCSTNQTIINKFLKYVLSDFEENRIRNQDKFSSFMSVVKCGIRGAEFVLQFVDQHYEKMVATFGDTRMADLLSKTSQSFSTEELINKYEELIGSRFENFVPVNTTLKQSLEIAKYDFQWYKKNSATINKWIKEFYNNDPTFTTEYRLPLDIIPKKYHIEVTPYFVVGNFTFDGFVRINAEVQRATKTITLHANAINYSKVSVIVDKAPRPIKNIKKQPKYHFWVIELESELPRGTSLLIEITYNGVLNTEMNGFYRSSYTNKKGRKVWLASTHLEPCSGRKLFPSFDEPALKAIFIISVNRPANYVAISNMPLDMSKKSGDRIKDTFKETPLMSTYLVAIHVSDFKSQSDNTSDTLLRVWARPNAIDQADFSLDAMKRLLTRFEEDFQQKYHLPKLDMAALPDFASGAMENWGLLTFKEVFMLVDQKDTSISTRQAAFNVISHEISHQWFGNLVSPLWWKFLWLNEGFARYFQYFESAKLEPSWNLENQFVVDHLQVSFGVDGVTSTHPMSNDVYSPTQIRDMFDGISYAKAASIIRMVQKVFGPTIFDRALQNYLKTKKYDVAKPEDLYKAFQDQVNAAKYPLPTTVNKFLDSWTTQSGFPVLNVTISDGVASLSQERFLLRGKASSKNTWWVPVTWASKNNPSFNNTTPQFWLNTLTGSVNISAGGDEWVIFNVQESGYYRVNYDPESWYKIIDALAMMDDIHEVNRASIIDDLLNLGRTGYVDFGIVFSATRYLSRESNYVPWRAAFNGFNHLNKRLAGTETYKSFKEHLLTLIEPVYKSLGFYDVDGEDYQDTLLRRHVLLWACDYGHSDCRLESQKAFSKWRQNPKERVPVNQRSAVYCSAIRHGSSSDWEFLWKRYLEANVVSEKLVILEALGCTKNTTILQKYLRSAITFDSEIRLQDSQKVFSSVYDSSLIGASFSLDFLQKYYKDMYKYYGGYKEIKSILKGISSRLSTKELLAKFEAFSKAHQSGTPLSEIASNINSYLTRAQSEITWFETYSPRIYEWLDKTYPSTSYRLPTVIIPTHYDIYLNPKLQEAKFSGLVKISAKVLQKTVRIVLHASNIDIKDVQVHKSAETKNNVLSYNVDSETNKLSIYLSSIVPAGTKLEINIKYSGILVDDFQGFYLSSYVDDDGETHWIGATHFQPIYARKVFPCFDEPQFKAKFTIHIRREPKYKVISNMPLNNSQPIGDLIRDNFQETPLMSTYLIAFVVSDFGENTNKYNNLTIWGRSDLIEYTDYSLSVGEKSIKFLEDFTGVPYDLPKMDFAAIADFGRAAMENWGLVTFGELALILNDKYTSAFRRRSSGTLISHELVHTWFGNLVTCQWWDYIWLNEGFAEYFQWVTLNSVQPDWQLLDQFVVYDLQTALEFDVPPQTDPMTTSGSTPSHVKEKFSTVAYEKSASVLRMMHHSFGSTVFANALHDYLITHRYNNTTPDDLSLALQIQVDKAKTSWNLKVPVKTIMDSWTQQEGYPVINATLNGGRLSLTQERFLYFGNSSLANATFWVPITIADSKSRDFHETSPSFWFGERFTSTKLAIPDDWFILNVQEVGYYRVNYDNRTWWRLLSVLKSDFAVIHEVNRAQIIDDLLNLARADYVKYNLALEGTNYLKSEFSHFPWKAFFNNFKFLHQRFRGRDREELLAKHVLALVDEPFRKLGFEDEDGDRHVDMLNRLLIATWACKYGHEECVRRSLDVFAAFRKDTSKMISPNVREVVYCTAIKHGTTEDWDFLWDQYKKSKFVAHQSDILDGLGCSQNRSILFEYLKKSVSSDKAIRRLDVSKVFSAVFSSGEVGTNAVLDFLIHRYQDLRQYFNNWDEVGELFVLLSEYLSTSEQYNKLQTFAELTGDNLPDMAPVLDVVREKAKENLNWFRIYSADIISWLETTYKEVSPTDTSADLHGHSTGKETRRG
ncbi:putative aminopeptidase-2 isoform X2 [Orussus abietinus]|uniref:putative aminopeptidase-2 isoform X2 n=1 Tax=Orussus abietinus TaxID=222816 RepID=UPI000625944B|nr:putative aminopeptidase-2 isoform X2 [Orussus abietinus]